MSRQPLNTVEPDLFGLAAWPLAKRLLSLMHRKGLITREEGNAVIDGALVLLEGLDQRYDGEAIRGARVLLGATLSSWHDEPASR